MDSHQRKSSPAESSRPAPPPTLVRAQQHELENLRALPRRELQALAKRFKIKANAKSADIIKQLMNCAFAANANIAKGPVNLADVNATAAEETDAAHAVPHTAITIFKAERAAAKQPRAMQGYCRDATTTADNLRAQPRRELQALAKRFKIQANAKSADIINQLMNCESFSQTSSRTEHYTKESDEPDDNAFDANADISKGLVNLAAVNSSAAAAPAAASAVPHTATTICMGKRDAATARDNQTDFAEGIFSELTTRTIFRPNHEPAVIKCRIPQSPQEIIASSILYLTQHELHQAADAPQHVRLTAIRRNSPRTARSAALPSAKFPRKFYAHNTRNTARRAARMNGRAA
jgi:hypothetical protein